MDWFMDTVCGGRSQETYQKLWDAADFTRPGRELFYPDFVTGCGGWKNLDLGSARTRLFQSVIEALTFEAKRIITVCEAAGGKDFSEVCIGGGTARSEKWLQLRADIFGRPVVLMKNIEISSAGAAVIAAESLGIYPGIKDAEANMAVRGTVFTPNEKVKAFYEEKYQQYTGGNQNGQGQNGGND